MIKSMQWRIIIVLAVIAAAVYYSYPLQEKISLGLDLSGGMHLVLQVETDKAIEVELVRVKSDVEKELIKRKIDFDTSSVEGNSLTVTFKDMESRQAGYDFLHGEYAIFTVNTTGTVTAPAVEFEIPARRVEEIKEQAFEQAIETIRNRIDETGVREPIVQRQGIAGDRILIQLPGIDDAERAKKLIGRTAFLEFRLVKDGPATKESLLAASGGTTPFGYELLPYADPTSREQLYYLLEKEAKVTGADLADARVGRGQYNQFTVDFELNRYGARKFGEVTGNNVGESLAIVLDGKVQSAPNIKSRITNQGQITGRFTHEEAKDLAIVLRAGALPAPVSYLEERSVGPSLGRDSISKGIKSIIIGGIIVLIFMVVYYKVSGLIANFALLLNVVLITGALGALHATLTLPGIAGIILTIGMAVDANVLIYERIKEELRLGKTIRTAVEAGFSRAFLTILDANVTTLIAAAVLMNFGSGPVRGFAVTLTFGIVSSMFTALFVSRLVFDLILQNRTITTLKI